MRIINFVKDAVFGNPSKKRSGSLSRSYLTNRNAVQVNEENALELSDILTCVRVLAESVACLPLDIYIKGKSGGEKATEHPLHELLRWQPNAQMTSYDLRLWLMIDALLRGNGFAQVIRDATGNVLEIHPLFASKMSYEVMDNGIPYYCYPDPENEGEKVYLSQEEEIGRASCRERV